MNALSASAARKKGRRALTWLAIAGVAGGLPACASRSQFQRGYDAGAGDAVKRQYWILQNMQQASAETAAPRVRVYRLPVEPTPDATVKTVPYEIAVPIYE